LTPFGRNVYAIWGNRDAAPLRGIRVPRVETFAYGLAAMFHRPGRNTLRKYHGFWATRGWRRMADGAITAAILGGTSLKGGQGTIVGTVFGTLLMAAVSNGFLF
jgi:ribose transport system permease protein